MTKQIDTQNNSIKTDCIEIDVEKLEREMASDVQAVLCERFVKTLKNCRDALSENETIADSLDRIFFLDERNHDFLDLVAKQSLLSAKRKILSGVRVLDEDLVALETYRVSKNKDVLNLADEIFEIYKTTQERCNSSSE